MYEPNNDQSVSDGFDRLQLSKSISPSDITNSSPSDFKRSYPSPILSNLPSLFNNLRSNDRKDTKSSNGSPGKSWLKKFLSPNNKSTDDLSQMEQNKPGAEHARDKTKSSVVEEVITNNIIGYKSMDNDVEVSSHVFKDIDLVKIPSVFFKEGLPLLKVSHKSKKRAFFRIDEKNFRFYISIASSASSTASNGLHRLLTPTASPSKTKSYEFSNDDIKAIFSQKDASNYREELHISKEFEKQWLTIIYYDKSKNKLKTIHVILDTEHDLKKLLSVLLNLNKLRSILAKNYLIDLNDIDDIQRGMIIGGYNEENEKQLRQFLSFSDILKYSKRLNININPSYLKTIFNSVSNDNGADRGLDFEQFKTFVSILKRRNDIIVIWNELCGTNQSMTYDIFKTFMIDIQQEAYSDDYLLKLFKRFCIEDRSYWIPENFNNFLLSKYSLPLYNIGGDIGYYDYPLNEYFISSSHNTYLMGRQVAGDSSIEGYIKALQRGCRCVEVDVWDGYNEDPETNEKTLNEPIVSHGRTFTTAISLRNVIKTIKKYAFITSPYPLIISLEINCSIDNQFEVVTILKEVLGNTLLLDSINDESILPTPLELKHKILLKVKKTSPFNDLIADDNGNYVSSTTTTTSTSFSEDSGTGGNKRRSSFSIRRRNSPKKITDALSDLGIYLQGLKFRNFSLPESKTFNHCFSLSEKSINSMLKDDVKCTSLDKHNMRYFMRVYPSKIRLKSSNFLPMLYWSHGVQMVATNWQTYDLGQQLNEALFESTNRNGYVLKPDELRKLPIKPLLRLSFLSRLVKTKFDIEIISAHQLPKLKGSTSAINPFITFEILGHDSISWDIKANRSRTSIISENGFNPTWNEKFSGVITSSGQFIFVRFTINTSSSALEEEETNTIGYVVCRLCDIKKGYRYLQINDLLGEELIHSSLFVKIKYQEL